MRAFGVLWLGGFLKWQATFSKLQCFYCTNASNIHRYNYYARFFIKGTVRKILTVFLFHPNRINTT